MTDPRRQTEDPRSCDEPLAEQAGKGSAQAFAALVARHRDAVYVIARNMCATLREAEHVVQETFLSAWRSIGSLPKGSTFATWLRGIAMRSALAQRQRDRLSPQCSLETFLPAFDRAGRVVTKGGFWQPDGSPRPSIEVTGLLREALECVDEPIRAAFVLTDLLELPAGEAATVLETSPEALCRDAHRARLLMRGFLERL
jgi:RNA polymerase sigma factor (sigma-70 family)